MTEESQVLRDLSASGTGKVLVEYMRRKAQELTDTRKFKSKPFSQEWQIEAAAGLKAAECLEDLIKPLLPRSEHAVDKTNPYV